MIKTPAGNFLVGTSGNLYIVTDGAGAIFKVKRDKTCSCGTEKCKHVDAVKEYRKAGGAQPAECPQPESTPEPCLVYDRFVVPKRQSPEQNHAEGVHYQEFVDRAKRIRAKRQYALQDPHPMLSYFVELNRLTRNPDQVKSFMDKWELKYETLLPGDKEQAHLL